MKRTAKTIAQGDVTTTAVGTSKVITIAKEIAVRDSGADKTFAVKEIISSYNSRTETKFSKKFAPYAVINY